MFPFFELARQIREADASGSSLANMHDADTHGYLKGLLRIAEDYERLKRVEDERPILDFSAFERLNLARCEAPNGFNHPLESWNLSDWFTAMVGEFGEAGNVVKKLNRYRDGIAGNTETEQELQDKLGREIADSFIYMVLFCLRARIDLAKVVIETFNAKSKKLGWSFENCEPPYQSREQRLTETICQNPLATKVETVELSEIRKWPPNNKIGGVMEPLRAEEAVLIRPSYPKSVNLNEDVWVKFTPEVINALKKRWAERFGMPIDFEKSYPSVNGYRRMSFWSFIDEVAPFIEIGGYHPIEGGIVYFEDPNKNTPNANTQTPSPDVTLT